MTYHAMRHNISSSIRLARLNQALQRTGAKHFSLMRHWFYSMIGFGRAAQIQEGNENVV
jgi:hypothetical protein